MQIINSDLFRYKCRKDESVDSFKIGILLVFIFQFFMLYLQPSILYFFLQNGGLITSNPVELIAGKFFQLSFINYFLFMTETILVFILDIFDIFNIPCLIKTVDNLFFVAVKIQIYLADFLPLIIIFLTCVIKVSLLTLLKLSFWGPNISIIQL